MEATPISTRNADDFAFLERQQPTFGTDRTCLICEKRLSTYNRGDVCFSHDVTAAEIERIRKEKGIIKPKKEGDMPRERGTCDNCKRVDMAIQKRGTHGMLCGSCGGAIRGLNPSDAEKALAEKAAKYAGKGKMAPAEKAEKPEKKKRSYKRSKPKIANKKEPLYGLFFDQDSVLKKVLNNYNNHLDEAEKLMVCLLTLREYGVEVKMPDRYVMRGE